MEVLEDINKNRGTTIIMATHDKEIVNKLGLDTSYSEENGLNLKIMV